MPTPDAIFTADGGSPTVWLLRHITANGRRRTMISLTHGTMANAMPQALGAKRAFPDRQVISMSGDGGLAMLLGDLLTAIQEKIPIKVAVFNNGALGFVELEMKVEGRRADAGALEVGTAEVLAHPSRRPLRGLLRVRFFSSRPETA